MRTFTGNNYQFRPSLDALLEVVKGNTMIIKPKLQALYDHALYASFLDGDVAEAGVWKGGSLFVIASVMYKHKIYGFDSWDGLPAPVEQDLEQAGLKEGSITIQSNMTEGWGKCEPPVDMFHKFGDRVELIKGWFVDTLPGVRDKKFCFVHIDCDRYEPYIECLNFFWPRLVKGGVMIFDDYGFAPTPGATTAIDEFFVDKLNEVRYTTKGALHLVRR